MTAISCREPGTSVACITSCCVPSPVSFRAEGTNRIAEGDGNCFKQSSEIFIVCDDDDVEPTNRASFRRASQAVSLHPHMPPHLWIQFGTWPRPWLQPRPRPQPRWGGGTVENSNGGKEGAIILEDLMLKGGGFHSDVLVNFHLKRRSPRWRRFLYKSFPGPKLIPGWVKRNLEFISFSLQLINSLGYEFAIIYISQSFADTDHKRFLSICFTGFYFDIHVRSLFQKISRFEKKCDLILKWKCICHKQKSETNNRPSLNITCIDSIRLVLDFRT